MKKIAVFILVLLVLLVGYFAFGVYYSNKQVNAFFNHNDGILYEHSGLKWKLIEAETTLFKASYKTEILENDNTIATLKHEAIFGMRFNPFKIGSIDTKGEIIFNNDETSEILQQEFDLKSSIVVGGIKSNIVINNGNASKYDMYSGEDENITWQDVKMNFFISFGRDKLDFDADIPFVKFDGALGKFFILEGQKYKSDSNKKDGLWMGDSGVNIDKIEFSDGYSVNFLLSKLNISSNVDTGESSTIKNINKISFSELKYVDFDKAEDVLLSDIVLNFNLENLDLESMKKITEALSTIDPTNDSQASFVLLSLFGYMSDILAKHPKIVLEELSGKYANQSGKVSGFAQYIGNGDLMNVYTNFNKDIVMKMDFEFAQEALQKYFEQEISTNYYGYDAKDDEAFQEKLDEEKINLSIETFEEKTGMRAENGLYKGTLEFNEGGFLLNGKPYRSIAEYDYDFEGDAE